MSTTRADHEPAIAGTPLLPPTTLRERFERLREWRDAVGAELRRLPETLGQLRKGVVNFNGVSEQIAVEAVTSELAKLPDTLSQLRAGVVNFNAVSDRLAIATEGIERMTRHAEATGYVDVVRRVDDAVGIVTRQIANARETAPASFELVQSSVNELTRTVGRLAEMIPGAPRSRARPAPTAAKPARSTKSTKKPPSTGGR